MRNRLTVLALLTLTGCTASSSRTAESRQAETSDPPPTNEWQLDPADTTAAISSQSSEATLRLRFGKSEVDSARIELGEGETTPGTVIFPRDSLRRAEIVWQDTVSRSHPARVILRGSASRWRVGPGVSLNTSLADLERLNGRPFTLAGFGWDYAGVVTSWDLGALDTALAGIKLYLDPGPAQYESAPYSQVLGDRDYSSALPAMQQLSPRVRTIFIDFESR
jgi:hypothetical protein